MKLYAYKHIYSIVVVVYISHGRNIYMKNENRC